jgi:hypothetical protein
MACLRLLNGVIIGKTCVSTLCSFIVWGGKSFGKTVDGGADEEGEFVFFVECDPDFICIPPRVDPMKRVKYLSAV